MELIDYLRIAKRRLWVLILVPILAGVGVGAAVILAPLHYRATVTVTPSALVGGNPGNQYSGSQAVSQYVSMFQSTAMGPKVAAAVSSKTGIKRAQLSAGLAVTQVGASSVMTVSYTGRAKHIVGPVATAVSEATLNTMFASQVKLAEAGVTSAKNNLVATNDAIAAWGRKNHVVDPDAAYQAQLNRINGLLQQQATLQANGNAAAAAALSGAIATARAGLTRYGPLLASYHTLTAEQTSAETALTNAQQSLQQVRSQLGAADPSQVVFTGGTHAVSRRSSLLTEVIPAIGAGVFLAVFLVAIIELVAQARRQHREADLEAAEAQARSVRLAGNTSTAYPSERPRGARGPLVTKPVAKTRR